MKIGEKAPAITLKDQDNNTISLSDFIGKQVVVFFYPKDNTPGCTKEACEFTSKKNNFESKNTIIIGISKDSVQSHQKFIEKQDLNIILLSDPNGQACEAFGVWKEKKNYGKTYMGIVRTTFLIDEEGFIKNIWDNVRVNGHVDAVFQAL